MADGLSDRLKRTVREELDAAFEQGRRAARSEAESNGGDPERLRGFAAGIEAASAVFEGAEAVQEVGRVAERLREVAGEMDRPEPEPEPGVEPGPSS